MENTSMDMVSIEHLAEAIHCTDEEKRVFDKYTCDYDFTVVMKQGPEWIFSLLNVVRAELTGDEIVLEDYRCLNRVFIRVLEWLIEGSTYLKCYEGIKLNDSRMLLERYLDEAIASREAMCLIDRGEAGDYVTDKLQKLTESGYLFKKSLVWITITTITRLAPRLSFLSTESFVLLVYHSLNKRLPEVEASLEERVALIREQDDILDIDERTKEELREAVWIFAAKILSSIPGQEELARLRSLFFRYLYIVRDKQDDFLRENAFHSVLFFRKNPVFAWEDVLDFSIEKLVVAIKSKTGEVLRNFRGRTFVGEGSLSLDTKSITLALDTSVRFDMVMEMDGLAFRVGSNRQKMNFDESFSEVTKTWRSVLADFSDNQKQEVVKGRRPPVGAIVMIEIKLVYDQNPTLAFVSVVDDWYEGDGVLHVSNITRVKLNSLETILPPGMLLTATVVESTNEKLQFSIWEEVNRSAAIRLHIGELCHALFLYKKNDTWIWLSREGYMVYTVAREEVDPRENDYYSLKITNIPLRGRVWGEVINPSDVTFDRHDAVAKLLSAYAEDCKHFRPEEVPETSNAGKMERLGNISEGYVKELMRVLSLYVTREIKLENLNLLYYIRLLAHVLDDGRLKMYWDCQINYLVIKHQFVEEEMEEIDVKALERDFHAFPTLKRQWTIIKILAAYRDEGQVDASAREKLLTLFSLEARGRENEEGVYFGERDMTREFESSIVYSVHSEGADVEGQMDTVMRAICGFLNGRGGVIYLGVDDDGRPVGVQDDLDYLYCTPEKYELFLHKRIQEAFGANVDNLILIRQKQYDDDLVVALSVPPYRHVVEYDAVAWERQGKELQEMNEEKVDALKKQRKATKFYAAAKEPLFPGDTWLMGHELSRI